MEQLLPILIQLIGGGAGGNIAGTILKNLPLTKIVQTVVGLIGGVAGGQLAGLIPALESVIGGGGAGGILGNAGSAGIGGAILTIIVGFIKKSMAGGAR